VRLAEEKKPAQAKLGRRTLPSQMNSEVWATTPAVPESYFTIFPSVETLGYSRDTLQGLILVDSCLCNREFFRGWVTSPLR
jgi:hypothetical protein